MLRRDRSCHRSAKLVLRLNPAEKALITRAAVLAQTDITNFILRTVLPEAQAIIDQHERLKLSKRDSLLVMELLENPPPANAKLRKAARALLERS